MTPRLFAISDIHGEFNALIKLLRRVEYRRGIDRIVFLGDYVNYYGKKPLEVVNLIMKLVEEDGAVALRGNHEQMYINLESGNPRKVKSAERMLDRSADKKRFTRDAYLKYPSVYQRHIEFFRSLPLYYDDGKHLFVHAGTGPKGTLKNPFYLLWDGDFYTRDTSHIDRLIIHGHKPVYHIRKNNVATNYVTPEVRGNKICIDVGSGWGLGILQVKPVLRWWYIPLRKERRRRRLEARRVSMPSLIY